MFNHIDFADKLSRYQQNRVFMKCHRDKTNLPNDEYHLVMILSLSKCFVFGGAAFEILSDSSKRSLLLSCADAGREEPSWGKVPLGSPYISSLAVAT